jgi:type III pantothenate kinase
MRDCKRERTQGDSMPASEQYIVAVDVGNSLTRLGLAPAGSSELAATFSVTTPAALTADEARLTLAQFVRDAGCNVAPGFLHSIIASVVPQLTGAWTEALARSCAERPLVVGPGLKTGIAMHYNDPAEVGADRIADLVAARAAYGYPLVAVDLGTTTNIEVLDKTGAFAGGIIAPGLEVSARAASQAAAKLSSPDLRAPEHIIGKSTREALQAGMVMGEVARIDGLVGMVWAELGYKTPLVISGHYAQAIAALSAHPMTCDDTLTLRGLLVLYTLNRKP